MGRSESPRRSCRRGAADHAEDRRQSRRACRWRCSTACGATSSRTARSSTRTWRPTFYGANRPGAKVSQGTLDQFWLWSMQAGLKNAYDSIKAFSETDFTDDLKKFDVPTLVLHGEDDQIVPVQDSALKSARLHQGRKGDLLSGRAARHHSYAPGSGQRRSARLHQGLRAAALQAPTWGLHASHIANLENGGSHARTCVWL